MILLAESLVILRGGRLVVSGLSFRLARGEALVLTGPNGAGKTTLIRALAGFLPVTAGSVRLEGGDEDDSIAERSHFIGHRDGIKSAFTVRENAQFFADWLRVAGPASPPAAATASVDDALERLGLDMLAQVPAGYLSAGQRRRLGLTRLLLSWRPLWLLDEPTVSLDAAAVAGLAGIIREHLSRGGMAIAATHIPLGLHGARELRLGAASTAGGDA